MADDLTPDDPVTAANLALVQRMIESAFGDAIQRLAPVAMTALSGRQFTDCQLAVFVEGLAQVLSIYDDASIASQVDAIAKTIREKALRYSQSKAMAQAIITRAARGEKFDA